MPAISGLRGTGNWGTDERPKDFRESILWINPNGDTPLFALTARARKVVKKDPEFHWWAESMNNVRLQINGTIDSATTLVTVDSVDPTESTMDALYGTATHLKPGDILYAEPASDSATLDQELILVRQVISATQFTVSRGFGGTTPASLVNDRYLLLIGSAYAEGTPAPIATSRNPTKFYNYTQIFKDTYNITGTADVTASRTGDPWSNDKKRKMFDHARGIEWAMLLGRKSETVGDNGQPLRTMAGFRAQVPSSRTTVGVANVDAMMTALLPVFDYKVPGSDDTRVAFVGNRAKLEMAKMVRASTGMNIDINIKDNFSYYGMDFETWKTPLGTLRVKSHPLLNSHPIYRNSMFIFDFNAIAYVTLKGRDTDTKDDVQNKDEDLRRGYVQTECSLMVDAGGLSCGYIGGIVQA